MRMISLLALAMVLGPAPSAHAQSGDAGNGIIQGSPQGSPNVIVGGHPAARTGDNAGNKAVVGAGSQNVFIGGKPAARTGDRTSCGGVITGGSRNVFVNGKPLAAAGDRASGC